MENILFVINDGFEEVETITPYDLLKRAGFNVVLASNDIYVKGSHDLIVKSDELLRMVDFKKFDMVVLSGGRQYQHNKEDKLYLECLRYFYEKKAVAAICATPTILGENGMLLDKKYTLFTPMNKNFGGEFTNARVQRDSNIITGRSCGTALDFAYEILRYFGKDELVEKIKEDILDK